MADPALSPRFLHQVMLDFSFFIARGLQSPKHRKTRMLGLRGTLSRTLPLFCLRVSSQKAVGVTIPSGLSRLGATPCFR